MAIIWKLEVGAVKQTFADWGFEAPVIEERSLAGGTAAWRGAGHAVDAVAAITWGDAVKVIRVDAGVETIWWQGRIDQLPRHGGSGREDLDYVAADPWWHLEDLSYQQGWNVDNGAGITLLNKSRVFTGVSIAGTKQTTKDTIADVLTFARDVAGRPIEFDLSEFTGVDAPIDILLDYKCADVIRHVLQWTPDAVSWWDHATTPPTLHIARRASLAAANIAFPSADYLIEDLAIAPRPELQLQAVVINFERTNTVNGQAFLQVITDKAPTSGVTGFEERAIVETMQFDGSQETTMSAEIEVETPAYNTLAFWQAKCPELADNRLADFSFVGSAERTGSLPRILTRGQIAPWMKTSGGSPVSVEAVVFKARIRFKRYYSNPAAPNADLEVLFLRDEEELKTFTATATDATSGTYTGRASLVYAEPLPVGLAQAIYDANSVLHYEGSFKLVEDECSGLVRLKHVLNIAGGLSDWETMNAVVQGVTFEIETGTTQVQFGPPKTLNMDALVELMRVNRQRNVYINPYAQQSGQSIGSAPVELPRDAAAANSSGASMQSHRVKIGNAGNASAGRIDLDPTPADQTGSVPAQTLKPRWTKVCDNGTEKWCLVLRSAAISQLPAGVVATD